MPKPLKNSNAFFYTMTALKAVPRGWSTVQDKLLKRQPEVLADRQPEILANLWIDDDERSIAGDVQRAYARDEFLKGHGVIVRMHGRDVSGAVYTRTSSSRYNPDVVATESITFLRRSLVDALVQDGIDPAVARYEVGVMPVDVQYWVHPAAHLFHAQDSLRLRTARESLQDREDVTFYDLECVDPANVVTR